MKFKILIYTFLLFIVINKGQSQLVLDSIYNYTYLEEVLDSAKAEHHIKKLADIYYLMGTYEDHINANHKKAFDNFTWSLVYYKMLKDSIQIDNINYKIAIKYAQSNMYTEAINLLTEIKDKLIAKKQLKPSIQALLDIARVHHERSELEKELNSLEEAKKLNKKLNDKILRVEITLQEIEPLLQYKDYNAALNKAFYAFKLTNKLDAPILKGIAISKIGKLNLLQNNYKNAIKYLESSLNYTNNIPYDKHRLECYDDLAESYQQLENFKEAFYFQKKYTALNDSILNFDRIKAMNTVAIKYESREKKDVIESLEKENIEVQDTNATQKNWLYILLTGLILLIIAGYYLIRYYSHRIKTNKIITLQKEKINTQKIRELEDKIEMSSMESLIEGQEKERHRVAQDLHDSLGGLLSTIKLQFNHLVHKNKSDNNENNIQESSESSKVNELLDLAVNEIRTISHNLQPESLNRLGLIPAIQDLVTRFRTDANPNIDFQYYNIPSDLDKKTSLNIYRIIQELLNNAIKHSKASDILIQLNNEPDGDILIQFEDDGVGYDIKKIKSKGMGLENIKSRIAYLKGEVEMDSNPGEGTSVLIRVRRKTR